MTLASASLTEGLRKWVEGKNKFFGSLIRCPFCVSYWVAIPIVMYYRPITVHSGSYVADLAISVFSVIGLATFFGQKTF